MDSIVSQLTRRDSYGIDGLSKIQLPHTPQRNRDFSKLSIIQTNTNLHPFPLPPVILSPNLRIYFSYSGDWRNRNSAVVIMKNFLTNFLNQAPYHSKPVK